MSAAKKFLTPDQLAARLESVVSKGTLANWRASGRNPGPPYTKVGGRVLYPIDQLEAWEAKNTITPANDDGKQP